MQTLSLPSPAKLNLFLHIVGRRPDGYHLLQTAFQFLDFCDHILFTPTDNNEIKVVVTNADIPSESNLITKAARLLATRKSGNAGVIIKVLKKIPLGSGLGGGSSNAATTLLALNYLWGLGLNQTELLEIGLALGADVPIFIHGHAAFAEGVGDKLQSIAPEEDWVLLLMPNCQVDTGKIFSDSQLTRNTPQITIAEFSKNGGHNDCEPIARKHFPEIANALNCLSQYAIARMTGTGSGVFATFKDKETALEVAKKIPASHNGIVAKGLNISPLHSAIREKIGVSPSGKAQGFDPCIPRFES